MNELVGDENKAGKACNGGAWGNGVNGDDDVDDDDAIGVVDWYTLFVVDVLACCQCLIDVNFGLPRFLCLMSMQLSDFPNAEHRLQGRDTTRRVRIHDVHNAC